MERDPSRRIFLIDLSSNARASCAGIIETLRELTGEILVRRYISTSVLSCLGGDGSLNEREKGERKM